MPRERKSQTPRKHQITTNRQDPGSHRASRSPQDPPDRQDSQAVQARGPEAARRAVTPSRVGFTPAAAELIRRLSDRHGPLMFHQSGGCCDGSSPMCYPLGEFRTGASDVLLGELTVEGVGRPVPFWMSESQFAHWSHTHLTVDVVPGRGGGFSLEAPEGVRFLIRSRLLEES